MAVEARVPSTTQARALPFFYGWAIVGAGFVTMALGVNARNAPFSLLYPALLAEFGWDRGVTVGALRSAP